MWIKSGFSQKQQNSYRQRFLVLSTEDGVGRPLRVQLGELTHSSKFFEVRGVPCLEISRPFTRWRWDGEETEGGIEKKHACGYRERWKVQRNRQKKEMTGMEKNQRAQQQRSEQRKEEFSERCVVWKKESEQETERQGEVAFHAKRAVSICELLISRSFTVLNWAWPWENSHR